jgi:hypothetical protein
MGFETGTTGVGIPTCHVKCPNGYSYTAERCVSDKNSDYSIGVTNLSTNSNPSQFSNESTRFLEELAKINEKIEADMAARADVYSEKTSGADIVYDHHKIKSEYASAEAEQQLVAKFDKILETVKPPRPAVAGSEINKEQAQIMFLAAKQMYVVQVALLTILLCLMAFLFLPSSWAQAIVLLLLATGIASAIYLSKV